MLYIKRDGKSYFSMKYVYRHSSTKTDEIVSVPTELHPYILAKVIKVIFPALHVGVYRYTRTAPLYSSL